MQAIQSVLVVREVRSAESFDFSRWNTTLLVKVIDSFLDLFKCGKDAMLECMTGKFVSSFVNTVYQIAIRVIKRNKSCEFRRTSVGIRRVHDILADSIHTRNRETTTERQSDELRNRFGG